MLSLMRKSLITLTAAVALAAALPGFAQASTPRRGTSYTLADVSCAGAGAWLSVGEQALH